MNKKLTLARVDPSEEIKLVREVIIPADRRKDAIEKDTIELFVLRGVGISLLVAGIYLYFWGMP